MVGRKPEPFKLVLEEIPRPDGLSMTLVPEEPDALGRALRWEGRVALGPGVREGNIGYPITLRSDQVVAGAPPDEGGAGATYGARVITKARIVEVIDLEPRLLSFGLVRPGKVVQRADGKVSGPGGAAELLGVKPTTLTSKLEAFGLRPARSAGPARRRR